MPSLKRTSFFVDLMCATPEEQERLEQNKQELDRYLGVYPYNRYVPTEEDHFFSGSPVAIWGVKYNQTAFSY